MNEYKREIKVLEDDLEFEKRAIQRSMDNPDEYDGDPINEEYRIEEDYLKRMELNLKGIREGPPKKKESNVTRFFKI